MVVPNVWYLFERYRPASVCRATSIYVGAVLYSCGAHSNKELLLTRVTGWYASLVRRRAVQQNSESLCGAPSGTVSKG